MDRLLALLFAAASRAKQGGRDGSFLRCQGRLHRRHFVWYVSKLSDTRVRSRIVAQGIGLALFVLGLAVQSGPDLPGPELGHANDEKVDPDLITTGPYGRAVTPSTPGHSESVRSRGQPYGLVAVALLGCIRFQCGHGRALLGHALS